MEILDTLVYKTDEVTGKKRIGKTKVICIILFVLIFIWAVEINMSNPDMDIGLGVVIIAAIISSLIIVVPIGIVGFFIGKLLNGDKSKINNNQQMYNQNNYPNNQQIFNQQNFQNNPQVNTQQNFQNNPQMNNQQSIPNNQQSNNQQSYPDYNTYSNSNQRISNSENYQNISTNQKVITDESNTNQNMDYAVEFKTAIEENDSDKAVEILDNWDENDANYKYAKIIFDGMPPTELTLNELNEWLKIADNMNPKNESLKEWFKSTALQVIKLNE